MLGQVSGVKPWPSLWHATVRQYSNDDLLKAKGNMQPRTKPRTPLYRDRYRTSGHYYFSASLAGTLQTSNLWMAETNTYGLWNYFLRNSLKRQIIRKLFQYISNKMQRYTVHFNWKLFYHPSSGAQTKQLYLQHLVFVTPLLLPAAIVEELERQFHVFAMAAGSSNGVTNTRCCRYSCLRS